MSKLTSSADLETAKAIVACSKEGYFRIQFLGNYSETNNTRPFENSTAICQKCIIHFRILEICAKSYSAFI